MTHTDYRITIVCTSAPWHPGPRARMLPLAQYGAAHGMKVSLLCLDPHAATEPTLPTQNGGVKIIPVAQMHVDNNGNPYHGLQLLSIVVSATVALTRAIIRTRPTDIVIAKAQPMNGIAALIAGWWCKARVHLDSDDNEAESHQSADWFVIRLLGWCEHQLPRWVMTTTCATDWQTTVLQRRGVSAVTTIPNGLTTTQRTVPNESLLQTLRRRLQLPERYLVYVGNLSTRAHAVDLLIEAYAVAQVTVPLVIAGSGHDFATLQRSADSLGIGNSLQWLGHLSPSDTQILLAGACASVDPVRDSSAAAARCPLKILESIAQRTPVITSDIGDRRVILGAAGIYPAAGDVQSYADAIISICADDAAPRDQFPSLDAYAWEYVAGRWYAAHAIHVTEVLYA